MNTGVLKAGKRKTLKPVYKLAKGTTASGLYVFWVVDPFGSLAETNEGNNTGLMGRIP